MKKRIMFAVTLAMLLLLTASPGFADCMLEGYIIALDAVATRPASINRDDVRFRNILTKEFICDYFATNKYNIIEIEPGDNFDGRRGYHIIPYDNYEIENWVTSINGNPNFVCDNIKTSYYVNGDPFVSWYDLVALSGGGEVLGQYSDYYYGDGISEPYHRHTYPITDYPTIERLGLSRGDGHVATYTDDLRVIFHTYGMAYGSWPATAELHINNQRIDLRQNSRNFERASYETTFSHDIPLASIEDYLLIGENTIKLMVTDAVGRSREHEIGLIYNPTHTLTIYVNPDIGGNTNPAPGEYTFNHGETVNLSASAYKGWRFVCWSANVSGTNPNISVLMDRDKVAVANFREHRPVELGPGDPAGMGETILLPHGKRKTE